MTSEMTFASFHSSHGAIVHRLPLEVFPSFWAYVYIIQQGEFCILIDTGSGMDTSHQGLLEGLGQAGIRPSDLTQIVLTHAHIDHYGGLARLRPVTQAKIGVHELDLQTVAHHESRLAWIGRRLASFLADTGLAEDRREQLMSIYRLTKTIYQSVPVDFTLDGVDMRLGPLKFIHLPGHCPGHVAIRLDDLVFCGDMVVEGVTPHLSPESINPYSGLDHYLCSLEDLQQWAKEARLILNGHNDVITDLPNHIEATRENILRRMSRAVEALAHPCTIDQICRTVYGETNGYSQLLVVEKTGAYVEYLYEHGLVEITNPDELEQGGPACYRILRGEHETLVELGKKLHVHTGTHDQS